MNKNGLLLDGDTSGVNQILPHKHKLAWDLFLKGVANNWSPAEINMSDDVEQWKNDTLTKDEKLYKRIKDYKKRQKLKRGKK